MNGSPLPDRGKDGASRSRGRTAPGCLFYLLLITILLYVGFKVAEAYWTYYQVREQVREVLIWAVAGQPKPEGEIAKRVATGAGAVGVDLNPRNIQITQDSVNLTIHVYWTHDLEFPFYTFPLDLKLKLTEVKRWERGGLVVK